MKEPTSTGLERTLLRTLAREMTEDELKMVGGGASGACWVCRPNNIGPAGGDDRLYVRD